MPADSLDLSFLSEESEPVTGGDDLARLILKAQEHHQRAVDQLQLVVSQTDAGIKLGEGDDAIVFEKDSDRCKGFRVGVQIALHIIGEFPITIIENEEID
ncbi:hypothetical protein SAMN05661010_02556 [Modicisalibacter muralis]|uniref:Uncharacterized protein n=1 Tax=Modicisalibacter muralis TaxID=119000 RepID=A0A1G9MX65_9GAMM|nr:hypothetical protein [Halomonas muralis]SDL78808.1 hypothetical protein SAMN05661010_02556 [Halomonas muralis]